MKDYRELLLSLKDDYFSAESLLQEIVIAMSTQESQEMFEHIIRHYDIDIEEL